MSPSQKDASRRFSQKERTLIQPEHASSLPTSLTSSTIAVAASTSSKIGHRPPIHSRQSLQHEYASSPGSPAAPGCYPTGSPEPRDTLRSTPFNPTAETASGSYAATPGRSPSISPGEQVRTYSGRSSRATTEQQPRSSLRGSRSPEPGQSGSASVGAESSGQSTRMRRRPKTQVASACWKCKKDHLSCDPCRPCKRCINSGHQELCYDVAPKKRGRPKLDQRVEQESSTSVLNRKRQRHTYFEINPEATGAVPPQGLVETASRPPPPPPSSYPYQPAPAAEPPLHRPRSHYSYDTNSSSSLYSGESGQRSSRVSRDSHHSREDYRSSQPAASGLIQTPHGQASTSHPNSPTTYNFSNLVSSLPPTSPSLGTSLGMSGHRYRPNNPVNPQNFGTRPQQRHPPTSHPQPTAHGLHQPSPNYLPPRSPLLLQQPQASFNSQQQLSVLQPPVHQPAPSHPQSFGRTSSSQSRASSASLPPLTGSVSQPSSAERYDPVQEASGSTRREQAGSISSSRDNSAGARRHRGHGSGDHRRGHSHGSRRGSNEEGNGRKPRRSMKISDVMH